MALKAKALVKTNLDLWLNDLFLRNGLFVNVASGDTNIYNNDISLLSASSFDPSFSSDGTIFQSAFKNWVHEEGVTPIESGVVAPTVCSGIIVDGVFYPTATTSGTYSHVIDYPNGRVIFDSTLTGSPVVQADFSYKEVYVDFANALNNENMPIQIETEYKDNPQSTGVMTYPTSNVRTLPAVFIDVLSSRFTGHELGTADAIKDFVGVFHVWARDEFQRDIIEDIISDEYFSVIKGINFNTAPYPLLGKGEKNTNFVNYAHYANVNSPHFWRRMYVDNLEPRKDDSLYQIERSRITFNVKVYPIY